MAEGFSVAAANTGGWYALLDIVNEAAQELRNDRERDPEACPDCGEPLRLGPNSELYCRSDGSIWGAGSRRLGRVGTYHN
ncbi:hypothetical protein DMC63_01295 [Streptomyces sp. WAC 05977]|nr:hypothetical protein DMC63_01295 [Streptomyces sp. WAC 05977]